ncbi:MAG: uroporphyrinogen-III synthase [Gammaproteobacteria bacterium]|nr:uroporphyrinogen-III synthase [Gammaproteobacteria bacterium]
MNSADDALFHGVHVAVARPEQQADHLLKLFRQMGAETVHAPGVEIVPAVNVLWPDARVDTPSCVVFMSTNAVSCAREYLMSDVGQALLSNTQLWSVGPATAQTLENLVAAKACHPAVFSSQGLLANSRFLADAQSPVWIVQAQNGHKQLARTLQQLGKHVEVIHPYSQQHIEQISSELVDCCERASLDFLCCNSSSSLLALTKHMPATALPGWLNAKLVSGSERVIKKARELGFTSSPLLAADPGDEALVDVMVRWQREHAD